MSHKSKTPLPQQVYEALQAMQGFGRSKHQDRLDGVDSGYIYSFSTMKTYIRHGQYFIDWCRAEPSILEALGRKPRTLAECRPYVEDFIRHQESRGLSAYTVKMEAAALSKLYGERLDIRTRGTRRSDIVRSRGSVAMDAHFSEARNADFVTFCRCTGVRRSEYEKARPSDLVQMPDGSWALHIKGKGGKERLAPIVGTPEQVSDAVMHLYKREGSYIKAHAAADIHSYRSDYATAVYQMHARPVEMLRGQQVDYTALTGKTHRDGSHIYKSALYVMRGDRKGEVLDRAAMIQASQALGHNRESVVGEHYIRL